MKILNKIKKILTSVIMMLVALPSKIFAANVIDTSTWYASPSTKMRILIPIYIKPIYYVMLAIIFVIGIFVYLFKSKSNIKRKIITLLVIVAITVAIIFIIQFLLYIGGYYLL